MARVLDGQARASVKPQATDKSLLAHSAPVIPAKAGIQMIAAKRETATNKSILP